MGNIIIHPSDNVEVNLENGHKYARRDIKKGEAVIKYGFPVGEALCDIKKGEHVHSHNLRTALSARSEYTYAPVKTELKKSEPALISAYVRKNGKIGIRNDIWIIPTVGCINEAARKIAEKTGAIAFTHPYGCSQLGDDLTVTRKTLCGLIAHPNAGGVLVLGLGCENNNIKELKAVLGEYDSERVRFLNAQDCGDEITEGISLVNGLKELIKKDKRKEVPISQLTVGLKCGGSDGLSGITANPMVGRVTDRLISMGGACVLSEVPEMFGAEQLLLNRCETREVFDRAVKMINGFKDYFVSHNQPVSENPSPGNKEGGITTLEEKSLGCVQKGGTAVITDVLSYGDTVKKEGLSLLNGPGNDMVAVTNLTAAGCHLILFTTGRGTPLGAPVPTLKISTNTALAKKKSGWIDFDAQCGSDDGLFALIVDTANGKETKNELNAFRDIAIFKDGVTL
ncbi:MAG: altronate dehydratase family protein [Eubacterium sp.]|nr:altronate dehydratase family protein [Eubacterium sp.]